MGAITFISINMTLVSLFFIGVIIRAMYRFFVKKKIPAVTYTPYDDAMNGEKKE